MAAALLKHRAPVSRGVGFLLRSFDAIRSLGAASLPPSGAEEAETRPKRKKKKTLFEVAQFLPNWGIGYKMAKTHWRDVCYEITKINLYKVVSFLSSPLDALFLPLDGRHGKAWGIRYKAGLPAADAPMKLSGVNKRGWKYILESKKKTRSTPKMEDQNST
ncbi:hypothetical protein MUK42_17322 [Musa troglodytarum]|uniref:Uncharacterized protein n=1 Tax=Musa troglodytarum TaxID=320322 RepID=A0A9E7H4L1_9LILI|nr:hypothetical protein MUK42_17322 [Musa troglodytarum]